MKPFIFVALVALVLGVPVRAFASFALNDQQTKVVAAWLAIHPAYRVAEDGDCECDEDLRDIRNGDAAVPDYHPYTVSGDFNDGYLVILLWL
jgi:hypothetical protein